jgi:peptide/nickel transport system substrate-binding protein
MRKIVGQMHFVGVMKRRTAAMSHDPLERLVENYLRSRFSRREFVIRSLAMGLSAPTIAALLSACGPVATPTPQGTAPTSPPAATQAPTAAPAGATPRKGGSLVYGIHNELQPIDFNTPWFPEIGYSDIYEYLTTFDPKTGNLAPRLAESFEMSPDGLKISYKLRPGKKFHNGDPCDANAVKALFDYWIGPDSDFVEAFFKNVASVDAPDDVTVVLNMKGIDTQALYGTAYSFSPIEDIAVRQANREAFGKSLVMGTGPYKFKSWEGDTAVSVRFDDYFGAPDQMENKGPGYLDQLTYTWLPDQTTRSINLESGDFDIIEQPAPQVHYRTLFDRTGI